MDGVAAGDLNHTHRPRNGCAGAGGGGGNKHIHNWTQQTGSDVGVQTVITAVEVCAVTAKGLEQQVKHPHCLREDTSVGLTLFFHFM